MICKSCNQHWDDAFSYCAFCGGPLSAEENGQNPESSFCSGCGKTLMPEHKYCEYCGREAPKNPVSNGGDQTKSSELILSRDGIKPKRKDLFEILEIEVKPESGDTDHGMTNDSAEPPEDIADDDLNTYDGQDTVKAEYDYSPEAFVEAEYDVLQAESYYDAVGSWSEVDEETEYTEKAEGLKEPDDIAVPVNSEQPVYADSYEGIPASEEYAQEVKYDFAQSCQVVYADDADYYNREDDDFSDGFDDLEELSYDELEEQYGEMPFSDEEDLGYAIGADASPERRFSVEPSEEDGFPERHVHLFDYDELNDLRKQPIGIKSHSGNAEEKDDNDRLDRQLIAKRAKENRRFAFLWTDGFILMVLSLVSPVFSFGQGLIPKTYDCVLSAVIRNGPIFENHTAWQYGFSAAILFSALLVMMTATTRQRSGARRFSVIGIMAMLVLLGVYINIYGLPAALAAQTGSVTIFYWISLILMAAGIFI